jgi:hypothetical protein
MDYDLPIFRAEFTKSVREILARIAQSTGTLVTIVLGNDTVKIDCDRSSRAVLSVSHGDKSGRASGRLSWQLPTKGPHLSLYILVTERCF